MATLPNFAVRRKEPMLVRPAIETPWETKRLSDIDDQVFLRRHVPNIFFYRGGDDDRDPVAIIRRALGEALVPYYPLAGRLRGLDSGKLVVDCTGEGVLFQEVDADVQLAELEAAAGGLRPPFPYLDQLLFDFEGSSGRPLLLVQVTRLLCGGFVLAFRISHTICDGAGVAQFMTAVAELARGLPSPTISPAWSRELLRGRSPGKPSSAALQDAMIPPSGDKVMRTFTFTASDVANIKMRLPPCLRKTATTFETLMAALWRARTAALELLPDEEVSLVFACNLRGVRELGLPSGYYGNAVFHSTVLTTSERLLASSLGNLVEHVREAKAAVAAKFARSTTDDPPMLCGGWLNCGTPNAFRVSDIRHVGIHRVDFGWGAPVYCGRADAQYDVSFLHTIKNDEGGENAMAMSIVLPRAAMDRFAIKVETLLAQLAAVAPASSPMPKARL